ncbi:hypothetical protein COLO4_00987 [Corchorus olitorius]|uniref:Uncharacterized protein n=1 Tax=Corchorus olitorius TaxID=93759 RepID=A0A1R3L3A3_9ROSI|nr:hypothetical protein COLO4_00987 [Corchorus olitorius]
MTGRSDKALFSRPKISYFNIAALSKPDGTN